MTDDLAARVLRGERLALARGLTAAENGTAEGKRLLQSVYAHTGKAHVVGITGPAGSGKSTVTDTLTKFYRGEGRTVGIVAVDPSSPFSRGAVLGDRIRMQDHWSDSGVFIRSMASRGALGGLSATTFEAALLMDAFGQDIVIVETVGAGQDEVEIAGLADSTVVINTPATGDDIQAMKAGILEVADVLLVNKADLPGADTLTAQLKALLSMGEARPWKVPVIQAEGRTGRGIEELAAALAHHRDHLAQSGEMRALRLRQARHQVENILKEELLRKAIASSGGQAGMEALVERVAERGIDPRSAAGELSGSLQRVPVTG
ncbi:MAG: methylmalonyl Co-A mutase-associated GTPase MeaB [Dehalococcoidia bacterium]|nr:methylmalonyl Co-A mutase-associated GTPase MeaB [Dehalococcoidia bacterium]